jgi:hypothetical protein
VGVRVIAVAMLTLLATVAAAADTPALRLESGYADMYNLEFDAAHQVFRQWEQAHPDDAMGPVSDAAAHLFAEFDRLHILESELFVDNTRFQNRVRPVANPQVKQAFQSQLAKARGLAKKTLALNPRDSRALLAQVLASGLEGDYVALIDKRDLQGLSHIKQGRVLAQQLLELDPACYDAYLAIGVENYLLSLKPAPLRWILRLGGAQTDKAAGLAKLEVAAEKGHFLMPYARLLLAVAAIRDNDRERARALLAGLSRQFPHNHLYARELAKLD